jgi:hypothetical protein
VPIDVPYISGRLFTGFVDNGNSESLRKTIECQIASNVLGLVKEILSFSAKATLFIDLFTSSSTGHAVA